MKLTNYEKADALVISAPSVNPPHHTDRPQRNDEDAVSAYMSQAYIRVTVSDTIAAGQSPADRSGRYVCRRCDAPDVFFGVTGAVPARRV